MDPFFAEHGWMIVRGAVPAEVFAGLTAAFDQVLPPSARERAAATAVLELVGASRFHPALARHAGDSSIAGHVARALGCRRVQLLQDTLMLKPPHSDGRVEWHQDHTYTSFLEPASIVSVRLALTDCTRESGCMNVIDGSHRWGLVGEPQVLRAADVADTLALLPAWEAERARAAMRPLELRPGDISLHHCLTFHGSLENRSALPRKTVIVRMFDADCTLVPSRLPSAAAAAHFPADGQGHLATSAFPILHEA